MLIIRKKWVLIFLFLGSCLGVAQAEEDLISFRFQTMSWQNPIEDIYYQSGGEEKLVFTPNANFSNVMQYSGSKKVVFFRKIITEGVRSKLIVAEINMSATTSANDHYIFVFIKDSSGSYNIFPIQSREMVSEENQVTLVNLSRNSIVGRIDTEKFRLDPGKSDIIDVVPNEGGNVLAQFLLETAEGWKPLYSNYWKIYQGKQVYAFIARTSEVSRHVNVRLIFQHSDV